ncbi:efflux RND transporter periplasmic adaptor subunit [Rhodopseudomonas sp. BR0M22]|uniref:efflux RND transporter periplasmic adaptor subunit n=1 Tax=Rhodopseudomonas sp. BR0M22 TaxID=2269369 RepID=UPI0013DF2963|nr:efflux RND transporter periplasmic adaptor subunit [Rhodopseudomonas sp. BR0M22]NEW90583.1 efflux RND transporter periplasmic adaptor subunit [Rhodopseudomonas sp. BR0M22]
MVICVTTKTRAALRAACAFGVVVSLAGCGDGKQAGADQQTPPVAVSVVAVAPETLRIVSDLPGRIAPTRIAEVRPRVSGIIVERVFKQGTVVQQGDVLYRLDPAPFQVRVASAKAALQRAVATRTLAAQQAERQTRLKDRDVTTGQLYDKAVAELAQAEADEASARAGLQAAELDLQYTEVRAPITGRIGRALITEGALFTVGGSESLATIQQLDPVYADFTQSANELLELKHAAQRSAKPGDAIEAEVRLRFDNGTNYAYRGRLLFSEASVDATTGQVTLRGEFPNPDGDLLPGMYVRVLLVQGEQANVLAVPDRALRRDPGGQAQLYVVSADRKAELRPVTPSRLLDGRWIIASGLKAGDAVIVQGFQALSPGASVDPKPWPHAAAGTTSAASQAK